MSRCSSEEANQVADVLLAENSPVKLLKLDQEYFEEIMDLFKKLSPHKFSFVDVSLMILSKEFEAKVLTFDHRLEEKLKQS
jgi:predicted nucleic acid-binding protein